MKRNNITKSLILAGSLILPFMSSASEGLAPATGSYFSNPLFNTLLVVIIVLAIMVMVLSNALKNIIASDFFLEKIKKEKEQKNNGNVKTNGLLVIFLLMNLVAFSQEKVTGSLKNDSIGGLDQFTFYTMAITIGLELLVLGILFNTFKNILAQNNAKKQTATIETKPKGKTILDKLNDTVEIEQEESILLDHDYDGIKELDNNLPPWWKYGFYLTILVAVIYLINYHITKTAPLQGEEYTISLRKAEREIAEFMKTSANNVDESTVKMLTDPTDLDLGKNLFIANCAACHGQLGEGTVGPNLTDEYWLHGGGVKDIFKTVKYGWPDKGMKSWKDDFSPMQIAQITSFIRTLKGTNPPKPKEKQGDLYLEQELPTDSIVVKADTTKMVTELPK